MLTAQEIEKSRQSVNSFTFQTTMDCRLFLFASRGRVLCSLSRLEGQIERESRLRMENTEEEIVSDRWRDLAVG